MSVATPAIAILRGDPQHFRAMSGDRDRRPRPLDRTGNAFRRHTPIEPSLVPGRILAEEQFGQLHELPEPGDPLRGRPANSGGRGPSRRIPHTKRQLQPPPAEVVYRHRGLRERDRLPEYRLETSVPTRTRVVRSAISTSVAGPSKITWRGRSGSTTTSQFHNTSKPRRSASCQRRRRSPTGRCGYWYAQNRGFATAHLPA